MNDIATTAPIATRPSSQHNESGRTHGLELILWALEQNLLVLLAAPTLVALVAFLVSGGNWIVAVAAWLAVPLATIALPLVYLIYRSYAHDTDAADWRSAIEWKSEADAKAWYGKKIPMEILYEAYIAGTLNFKGDLYETLLRRNKLFRFCFT
jgi:hypothetical protein